MTRHWSAEFVGIPYLELGRSFAGVDCWGLPVLVFARCLGITLPTYDGAYLSPDEHAEIAAVIAREAASPIWLPGTGREFEIAMFRQGRYESHAGVVIEPGLMLHMVQDDAAKIERYDVGRWSTRLTGIYRFHLLDGAP